MSKSLYAAPSLRDGEGVFSKKPISTGSKILFFKGQKLKEKKLPLPYDSVTDHYMQIGIDTYLGPSGDTDDLINHSCDPNSGVIIKNGKVFLVAIKNIKEGEEITWDYSTTMKDDNWTMTCQCGAKHCRKLIREFKFLDKKQKERYKKAGVVPAYQESYGLW